MMIKTIMMWSCSECWSPSVAAVALSTICDSLFQNDQGGGVRLGPRRQVGIFRCPVASLSLINAYIINQSRSLVSTTTVRLLNVLFTRHNTSSLLLTSLTVMTSSGSSPPATGSWLEGRASSMFMRWVTSHFFIFLKAQNLELQSLRTCFSELHLEWQGYGGYVRMKIRSCFTMKLNLGF